MMTVLYNPLHITLPTANVQTRISTEQAAAIVFSHKELIGMFPTE